MTSAIQLGIDTLKVQIEERLKAFETWYRGSYLPNTTGLKNNMAKEFTERVFNGLGFQVELKRADTYSLELVPKDFSKYSVVTVYCRMDRYEMRRQQDLKLQDVPNDQFVEFNWYGSSCTMNDVDRMSYLMMMGKVAENAEQVAQIYKAYYPTIIQFEKELNSKQYDITKLERDLQEAEQALKDEDFKRFKIKAIEGDLVELPEHDDCRYNPTLDEYEIQKELAHVHLSYGRSRYDYYTCRKSFQVTNVSKRKTVTVLIDGKDSIEVTEKYFEQFLKDTYHYITEMVPEYAKRAAEKMEMRKS